MIFSDAKQSGGVKSNGTVDMYVPKQEKEKKKDNVPHPS